MSETQDVTFEYAFEHGAFPSQPLYGKGVIPGTVRDGSNMWKRGRKWVSDRGTSSAGSNGGANPLQLVGNVHGGMTGGGSVTLHASTTWFIGSGSAVVNGSAVGSGSSALQLLVSGSGVNAGLAKPGTPTFAATGNASSKFNGSYSICVVPYRSTTGAVGNRSNPSAVIAVKNLTGLITFPSPVTGQTHWLIYGSRRGFGSVGPWFRITSIDPVPVATLTKEIDYFDGELGDLAPTTNDPPPSGTHCAALGGVMCVIGSYGGYGISPSKVGQPEAYDVSQTSFLASREAVTAVTGRGTDGGVFVATRNSISLIILSGSEVTPVLPRGVFENVGVAHGNAMCWAHDTLYIFSSDGALCRTQGSQRPDYSFAIPYASWFRENGFTGSNTRLVFDEANGAILVCSGNKAVPFMIATEEWSTPITLPGSVTAGIALNGAGLVAVGSTNYTLDTGASNPSGGWHLQGPFEGARGKLMTAVEFYGAASGAMVMDLRKDLGSSSIGGKFPYSHPGGHGAVQKPNRRYRSVSLRVSGTLGNQEFYSATLNSTYEPGRH
jgi:hypothetical protein